MFASFVFNDTWFTLLLVLHVSGAIIGLGPSFAFSIIGPAIGKQEAPAASLALMKVMEKIERGLVLPILIVVQLTTGILLIFTRQLDAGFFHSNRAWLLAGLGVYIVAMAIPLRVLVPAVAKLIHMAENGQAGSPGFVELVSPARPVGPP